MLVPAKIDKSILPFMAFGSGAIVTISSAFMSLSVLVLTGAGVSIASNKSPAWGAFRMLLAGITASTVTYILGYSIGLLI